MDYNTRFIDECLELTNLKIRDRVLRETLIEYLKSLDNELFIYNGYRYFYGYRILLLKLEGVTCGDLNWNFICTVTNYNFERELYELELNNHSSRLTVGYVSTAKNLLEGLYIYILEKSDISLENFKGLRKYINLFKLGRLNKINKDYGNEILLKCIKNKYPLNSNIESIYQGLYKNKRGDTFLNINLNTKSNLLLNILKEFIEYEKKFTQNMPFKIEFLCFYYYFEESFGENKINNITDFDIKTFEEQYQYYKLKENLLNDFNLSYSLRRILIHMYIFIQKKIKSIDIEYDVFKDSWITVNLLANNKFIDVYEEGYVYIRYNQLEDYPKSDLWWLSLNNQMNKSASSHKSGNTFLDFSVFENDNIKNQVKDYIWNGNGLVKTRTNYFYHIKEFFNFIDEYTDDTYTNKMEQLNISFELIWAYKTQLEVIYANSSTIRSKLKAVRSFFIFNSKQYNIDKRTLDILTEVEDYKDGTPITVEDFRVLESQFKLYSESNKYKNGKLLYYIFIITATTNLRLGEVLGLERDCITFKDEKDNGTVRALRKTSNGKYIENEYPAYIIRIIELAKELTESISSKADKRLRKYIFLTKNREKVSLMPTQFSYTFSKIINDNKEQLSRKYSAYDLRHTFINVIYDEINEGNITIDKAQQIIGNKYETVMKNYRRKLEIKDYAEIMCGITISNVDICGEILKNSKEISNKSIVMKELGVCNESECIGSTLCLACNHFITTLNKIPKFEKEIQRLKKELINLNDIYRKKEIELELKLLGAYLVNMLELKNK